MPSQPEPWLRGPIAGIPPLLQPAAHAFTMALEDSEAAVKELTTDELWLKPAGAASVGFHLAHLSGSTDRLLTYAQGKPLTFGRADHGGDFDEQPLRAETAFQIRRPCLRFG